MLRRRLRRAAILPVTVALLAACGDSSSAPRAEPARTIARLSEVSSTVGATPSGFATADSVAVRVTDSVGNAIAGQTVAFAVIAGGGSVSPATKATGQDGIARVAWTVGGPGPQTLRASAGSLSVEIAVSAVSCAELALAVGEVTALSTTNAACAVLNGSGKRYVITIANAASSPSASAGYSGRGLAAATILEQSLALLPRYAPRANAAPAPRVAVGDLIPMKVPDINTDGCSAFDAVTARVVYAGRKGIVLEDTANALRGQVDTILTRVGRDFDDVIFPLLRANFGDPLAMDASLNNDGALYMLISDKVNKTIATGFVSASDFLPVSQCASSNMAEVFYARGLTPPGGGTAALDFSFASTTRRLESTIIHEAKHLTSIATRLSQGKVPGARPLEDAWLEESSAEIAMELLSRVTYGTAAKSNLDYATTLAREARPASGLPLNMFHPFTYLYTYFAAPETHSMVGRVTPDDFTFYGSGWAFLRWVIDTYAPSESAFLLAMTSDASHWGVENIEARTGKSFPQLFAEFSMALALDDYPAFTPIDARYSFPSWNVRSIFAGMNADFPVTFPFAAPLKVRSTAFGKFTVDVAGIRGGGFSVLELTGTPAARQLLELRGMNGSPFPQALRVTIARVQ